MPIDSSQHPPRTHLRRRLAGALAGSAIVAAGLATAVAPANADGSTGPTVPDAPMCSGYFGPQTCTGVNGTDQWSVVNGSDGMPSVSAVGLAMPSQFADDGTTLPIPNSQDADGNPVYPTPMPSGGSGTATHTWTLTVPDGTTALVLRESLTLFTRDAPTTVPQVTLTGPTGSKTDTTADQVKTLTWTNPPAGTYTVEVDTPATNESYDFYVSAAVVSPTTDDADSQFSATIAPDASSADPTANSVVTATWGDLLANTTYYGTVSYTGTDDVSLLEVDSQGGYQFQELTRPEMGGDNTVGSTLTISGPIWGTDPSFTGTFAPTVTYQWTRDDKPIAGATSSSYTLTLADAGHEVKGTETASQRSFSDYSDAADCESVPGCDPYVHQAVTVAPEDAFAASQPTITGTPRVGKTLTAHPGTWSAPGLTFDYQWTANGDPIANATEPTLTLLPGLAGKNVGVTVTDDTVGYTHATASSLTVKALATPKVTLRLSERKTYRTTYKKVRKVVDGKVTVVREKVRTLVRHVVARVTVTAAVPVSGKVRTVIAGVAHTLTLRGGTAAVDVIHMKPGTVSVTAEYAGSATVAPGTARASLRLR